MGDVLFLFPPLFTWRLLRNIIIDNPFSHDKGFANICLFIVKHLLLLSFVIIVSERIGFNSIQIQTDLTVLCILCGLHNDICRSIHTVKWGWGDRLLTAERLLCLWSFCTLKVNTGHYCRRTRVARKWPYCPFTAKIRSLNMIILLVDRSRFSFWDVFKQKLPRTLQFQLLRCWLSCHVWITTDIFVLWVSWSVKTFWHIVNLMWL